MSRSLGKNSKTKNLTKVEIEQARDEDWTAFEYFDAEEYELEVDARYEAKRKRERTDEELWGKMK